MIGNKTIKNKDNEKIKIKLKTKKIQTKMKLIYLVIYFIITCLFFSLFDVN